MKLKKILFGGKEISKDDPNYQELREKSLNAGERFARFIRLDKLFLHIQNFANRHSKVFLFTTCTIIVSLFILNVYRINNALRSSGTRTVNIEAARVLTDSITEIPLYNK